MFTEQKCNIRVTNICYHWHHNHCNHKLQVPLLQQNDVIARHNKMQKIYRKARTNGDVEREKVKSELNIWKLFSEYIQKIES